MTLRHTNILAAATLTVFGAVALPAIDIPTAAASTNCGSYTPVQAHQGDFNLVITTGNIGCAHARTILDDWDAGKGTQIARNGSEVDGYLCTGNPAGAYSDTGVLSFCDANGVHFELQKP
jgi:hypothetical protein